MLPHEVAAAVERLQSLMRHGGTKVIAQVYGYNGTYPLSSDEQLSAVHFDESCLANAYLKTLAAARAQEAERDDQITEAKLDAAFRRGTISKTNDTPAWYCGSVVNCTELSIRVVPACDDVFLWEAVNHESGSEPHWPSGIGHTLKSWSQLTALLAAMGGTRE